MKTLIILFFLVNISEASYYHDKFNGRKTASGEIFDNNKFTAAHKTLKFGTLLKVTDVTTNKSVVVKVNDRGPFVKGRDLDLSKVAFEQISNLKKGKTKVTYTIIKNEQK